LVRLKVKDGSQTIEELYNLKDDPTERDNIIRKHGEIVKKAQQPGTFNIFFLTE